MQELFIFDKSILDTLPKSERASYYDLLKKSLIFDKQPFFLNGNGLPDRDLNGFCKYLMYPIRGSYKTWATYASQISVYLRYIEAQEKSWIDATSEDLKNYYLVRTTGEFQFGSILKARSWNIAKAAIVHLYEYALEKDLIKKVPFAYRKSKAMFNGIDIVSASLGAKFTPEPINFISTQHYKAIWRPHLAKRDNAPRNLVLTDLLITSGLRISEALSLKVHQIPDPDNAVYAGRKNISLSVVGKGKKRRNVLVPKRIIRDIHFYIDDDRDIAIQVFKKKSRRTKELPDAVFLSDTGTPLSARSVQSFFNTISKITKIHLTPHGCRHTFAVFQLEAMIKRMAQNLKELRESGADAYRQIMNDPLRQLQLLLGHSHITTTYIYLDFLEESEALVDESLADWSNWENSYGE